MAYTEAQILTVGEEASISQYLAGNDAVNQSVFQGGFLWPSQQSIIFFVRTQLAWAVQFYVGTANIDAVTNYLISAMGKYIIEAKRTLNSSGGTTIIPSGNPSTIAFRTIRFTVGTSGMNDGDTTYTVVDSNILNESLIVTLDGSQPDFGAVYSTANVVITFSPAVSNGQKVIITYAKTT